MAENNQNQDLNQLLKVRREKLAALQADGKDPFQITKYDQTHHTDEVKKLYEAYEAEKLKDYTEPELPEEPAEDADNETISAYRQAKKAAYNARREILDADAPRVSIAGRMMFKRVMGKASFANLRDLKGDVQAYVSKDALGDDLYATFKKSDIGDIWGLKGYVFRTMTGEISVHAEEMTLLSKSLQILPEKFHGLTDTDTRYRQRYVDLIMNQESREVFVKRSQIIREIRNFLAGRDFMEVETPMLVHNAGGAAARPFETHYNSLDEDVKLRISLELYLKRLIVGGLERVFEIGRVFRNEGVDTRHNPEFTLMELYQAYTDYEGMMELTESMFRYLAEKVCGDTKISYQGTEIDLGKPFARMTMTEAVKKYAGIDFDEVADDEAAKALAKEKHIEFEDFHKKGDILNLFFEEFVEENTEDDELSQEPEILKKCKIYEASIKSQKKTIADLKKKLDENCRKRYDTFTDAEITDLLVNRKWYKTIDQGIQNLYVTVANHLTKRIVELYERYENTLPELTEKLAEEEKEVAAHLAQMGFKL